MTPVNGYYYTPKHIEYVSVTSLDICRSFLVPGVFSSIRGAFTDYFTYATLIYPTNTRDDEAFRQRYPEYFI